VAAGSGRKWKIINSIGAAREAGRSWGELRTLVGRWESLQFGRKWRAFALAAATLPPATEELPSRVGAHREPQLRVRASKSNELMAAPLPPHWRAVRLLWTPLKAPPRSTSTKRPLWSHLSQWLSNVGRAVASSSSWGPSTVVWAAHSIWVPIIVRRKSGVREWLLESWSFWSCSSPAETARWLSERAGRAAELAGRPVHYVQVHSTIQLKCSLAPLRRVRSLCSAFSVLSEFSALSPQAKVRPQLAQFECILCTQTETRTLSRRSQAVAGSQC